MLLTYSANSNIEFNIISKSEKYKRAFAVVDLVEVSFLYRQLGLLYSKILMKRRCSSPSWFMNVSSSQMATIAL
jgi:hypothetical protein